MTETPLPLPTEGGSYTRDAKGNLSPSPTEPEKAPRKPDVKEG